MAAAAGFLYGDSTPSPVRTDFIAFLRAVVDFGVTVLACDARIADAVAGVQRAADAIEKEIAEAEAFGTEVVRTLELAPIRDADSLAARCAARIRQGALDLIRGEAEAARTAVAGEQSRAVTRTVTEREACSKAFGALLLGNELPDEDLIVHVRSKGGAPYEAELVGRAPYGLEWTVAVDIPGSSLLASILRVDRLVERLEVDAPEESGWIRKETKIRPQRLDRLYVMDFVIDAAESAVKLRAEPDGTGDGFDVSWRAEPARIHLVRVAAASTVADAPYEVTGQDVAKLRALHASLAAMATALVSHKKSVTDARLDGTPIDKLEAPRMLVDRIVEYIAPTVQEMGRRSLTPGELVLKRVVDGSHRDELFVTRAELLDKIDPLPAPARRAFDALRLRERPGPSSAPPPRPHLPTLPLGTPKPDEAEAAPEPVHDLEPASRVQSSVPVVPRPSSGPAKT